MASIWTTRALPVGNPNIKPAPEDLDKFVILLLYGRNSFGDKIYAYLKITIGGLENLRNSIIQGQSFMPSDFGEVVAAGKGEPTAEVKAELATQYPMNNNTSGGDTTSDSAAPIPKKSWDEY